MASLPFCGCLVHTLQFDFIPTSWVHCVCFSTFSDVAHAVLDRCMSDNATEENPDIVNNKDYEVTFNFEFLEDWRPHETKFVDSITMRRNTRGHIATSVEADDSPVSSHQSAEDDVKHSANWKPKGFSKRYHPLHCMVSLLNGNH